MDEKKKAWKEEEWEQRIVKQAELESGTRSQTFKSAYEHVKTQGQYSSETLM